MRITVNHTFEEAVDIFNYPFFKLMRIAHDVHMQNFDELICSPNFKPTEEDLESRVW
jgi:hypothetical protein